MNIGIYCIYFDKLDNMYYIGCSSNLSKRTKYHLSMLKLGSHSNSRLQQAFLDYGPPVVEILEYCSLESLFDREIYWIKEFDAFIHGFNNTTGGDGGGFGEGVHNALYTENEYLEILSVLANTTLNLREVAKYTGKDLNVIKHISSLSGHSWLAEKDPINYNKIVEKYTNNSRNNSAESKGIIYPELISPEGDIFIVNNIHAFCRTHRLQPQNLHKVLTKQRRVHKGWTIANNT